MEVHEASHNKWNNKRKKFDPLNNLDQENMNLEAQIRSIISEVTKIEGHIKEEESNIHHKEQELESILSVLTSVLEYSDPDQLIQRDFGRNPLYNALT
jgi:peptidoglycan hydrolase CwlO-like protein